MFDDSFCTKTYFVRYAEELVVVRDVVKFRSEITVQPGYLETPFYMKVELFWLPPPIQNFGKCVTSPAAMKKEYEASMDKFKMV